MTTDRQQAAPSGTIAGVDVGGTFTDILVFDEATRTARVAKVPSTRTQEAAGFLGGLASAAAEVESLGAIVHGTTVVLSLGIGSCNE